MSAAATRARIEDIKNELEEIERMKVKEEKLKRTLAALERELEEQTGEDEEEEEEEVVPEATAVEAPPPVEEAPPQKECSAEELLQKKIKGLNKKLQQIQALKSKGGELDEDAKAKISREGLLKKQIEALKEGKEPPQDESELPPKPKAHELPKGEMVALPAEQAEREKRLKALKKKITQIVALKEKGGPYDAEQREKIASEHLVQREVQALESGAAEMEVGPMNEHEKHEKFLEEKHDIERKIKAITKKIAQIGDHKAKDDLHHTEQAKVENEASLKKEKGELERRLGQLNKDDQMRMAHRLGDEELKEHLEVKQKKKKGR